jgi:hypothetical protein
MIIWRFCDHSCCIIFRNEKQKKLNGFCKKKRRILIISNREHGIDNNIKGFLQMNIFGHRIKYLPSKGHVDRRLIDRACLLDARWVYFLWNPASELGGNQDKMSIIYSHFLKNHNVSADIYIQTVFEHSDFRNWEEVEAKTRKHSIKSVAGGSFIADQSVVSSLSANISSVLNIVWTQKFIMQAMARNVFHEGFIQFLSTMMIDELESSNNKTFTAQVVKFPKNWYDIQFDECCFIYNKINQVEDFKKNRYKFILFGMVKVDDDGFEASQEILLTPLSKKVTPEYQALVLWNFNQIVPLLESEEFSDMIHILKLKYFHGAIESVKKNRRATVKDRRLGFSANLKESIIRKKEQVKTLEEPLIDDTFSDQISFHEDPESRETRSFSQIASQKRLCLIKSHEEFDSSINNHRLLLIVDKSVKKILKRKFAYTMLCEKRNVDISIEDMKDSISNHIILCGYNRGCNQFIESIREETDIPIVIISDTSNMAEIANVALMYPNILFFEGDPMNIEHLENANIDECNHVVIPSNCEEEICESDCNSIIKANIIKQNWPQVSISIEFTSNEKSLL